MAKLITKAKQIIISAWGENDTTYPTSGEQLDYVIADTLSVNQDDAEEQTFEFETTDAPEVFYSAGAYKVDLNNAELSKDFMTKIMGWEETADPAGVVAPETYASLYVALQVKFAEDDYFFLPKISIAPKLVLESVKTNLVYGTLSGTASNAKVGGKNTPIARLKAPVLTATATYTKVTDPTGNPSTLGYYEKDTDGTYKPTTDATVQAGKDYYTKD